MKTGSGFLNSEKAAKLYQEAMLKGDLGAAEPLSRLLAEGDGVVQDVREAVNLLKNLQGADGGSARWSLANNFYTE